MKLLITGGTGQVGTELIALARSAGISIAAPDRAELDLASKAQIAAWVERDDWTAVINAAAYTQVDAAESDASTAAAINAMAPDYIARATARRHIPLIHISTDYIFDGTKASPYVETDSVRPLNVYGLTKEAGEQAVRAFNPHHVILRTSWVYSASGKNFVKTMLRLGAERDRLNVVSDQRGCPTAAKDIAAACLAIAGRFGDAGRDLPYGTFHFTNGGDVSWFDFARAIFALAAPEVPRPVVSPISSSEYPTPAKRPLDTRLDCTAIVNAWQIQQRPWKDALTETLAEILGQQQRPAHETGVKQHALRVPSQKGPRTLARQG